MEKPRNIWIIFYPVIGFLSFMWILFRIISKPSRINYPCVRSAMPFASSFILWVIGILSSAFLLKNIKKHLTNKSYLAASMVGIFMIGVLAITEFSESFAEQVFETSFHPQNSPIGKAEGFFPGRVVWVHDADATNQDCIPNWYGHAWFMNENNDQEVIDEMLSLGIRQLTGKATDIESWEEIFKYYNSTHGKDTTGYQPNEIIFIKTNATSSWSGNIDPSDYSIVFNQYYGISETSPHLILSLLRQLVNTGGVPQNKIYIGDPMKHIYKHCYELWHSEFPDIHYLDHDQNQDRDIAVKSNNVKIHYSDRGKILRTGTWTDASAGDPVYSDYIYEIFETTDYVINVPTLKAHKHAGITAFAKNHFGSHTRDDAKHLHGGLVAPEENNPRRQGYGLYRVTVDLMGHDILSGKNLFYLMDALWTSDMEINKPNKWMMSPFNNDWMSSIFLSQDPVAIESVGFDFLRAEYTQARGLNTYPQMEGVDDYLQQAADSSSWPEDIKYDPENDGTTINCLGVHEHWNNSVEKKYSRNLNTGDGIELIYTSPQIISVNQEISEYNKSFILYNNYPNPFNPSTTIKYEIPILTMSELGDNVLVTLVVFDILGREVATLVNEHQKTGSYEVEFLSDGMSSGVYFYRLFAGNYSNIKKMTLLR
ncbi:DUF362 domain-containing protein [Bacteroidota bacterium]